MLILYYVFTPIILTFALCKLVPRCRDYKKQVWKTNRFLLYSILILNMAKVFVDMIDAIYKKINVYDQTYCGWSMMFKTLAFDSSCFLTVQHMHTILKHVEDPLVNKINKVAKPIAISMLLSGVHVVILQNSFHAEFNRLDATCEYHYGPDREVDFWFSRLMILVAPVLLYYIYSLHKYTNGTMAVVLKPFIVKQDIVAFNQIL
jgi:hypothetical protein